MGTDFNSIGKGSVSTLGIDFIQSIIAEYRDNQFKFSTENLGFEDARSIWFDLPTLKNFIAEVENQAKLDNPELTDADLGVRMYFGAYPDNLPDGIVPEEYKKRHTLVMIPTKKENTEDGETYNQDFHSEGSSATARFALSTQAVLALNHGTLSPPEKPQGELY